MENESDVTREQMDETRASMSEKMETLEQRVIDTAHDAADAAGETVDDVKDAVQETVQNVKDAFNVRLQVARHPWAMVGGSVALGYLGGYLLFRHREAQPWAASQPAVSDNPKSTATHNGVVKDARFQEEAFGKKPVPNVDVHADPSWLGSVHHRFEPEINKAKGLAIGMVLGVARDVITQSVPDLFKAALVDVIDGVTVKLGGEPLHGPVPKDGPDASGERHDEPQPTPDKPESEAQRQDQTGGATVP
jgi:hypothetical protein